MQMAKILTHELNNQKLEKYLAEALATFKEELNKTSQNEAAKAKEQEETKILNEQLKLHADQQEHAAKAYREEPTESGAEQPVENVKKKQGLVLPTAPKAETSQSRKFSKAFIELSKKTHEETAEQGRTLTTAIVEILANNPDTAGIIEANGGREPFAEQCANEVAENIRRAPRYDQADQAQLNRVEESYNALIDRVRIAVQANHSTNDLVDVKSMLNQLFVQDPAPEQQPQGSIAPAATPKPKFSSANKFKTKQEEKEDEEEESFSVEGATSSA